MTASSTSFHSPFILAMAISMEYSLPEMSQILVTISFLSGIPISIAWVRLNVSSGCRSCPSSSVSWSQCRSRMPGFRRAVMIGT